MPYKTGNWGEQAKNRSKTRWFAYRLIVLGKLGGKCVKCGNDDYRVLQIDHKDGKGCEERRKLGYNSNYGVIKAVINGEREKYQLLCANCNWIKRWENDECKRGGD